MLRVASRRASAFRCPSPMPGLCRRRMGAPSPPWNDAFEEEGDHPPVGRVGEGEQERHGGAERDGARRADQARLEAVEQGARRLICARAAPGSNALAGQSAVSTRRRSGASATSSINARRRRPSDSPPAPRRGAHGRRSEPAAWTRPVRRAWPGSISIGEHVLEHLAIRLLVSERLCGGERQGLDGVTRSVAGRRRNARPRLDAKPTPGRRARG